MQIYTKINVSFLGNKFLLKLFDFNISNCSDWLQLSFCSYPKGGIYITKIDLKNQTSTNHKKMS